VDYELNMIKGRGGALTMEKILAYNSELRVFIADYTKLSERLGRKPIPVEVISAATRMVLRKLRELGFEVSVRKGTGKDGPVITDVGGIILDLHVDSVDDPRELYNKLKLIPGVVEVGLFIDLADLVILGYPEGVKTLRKQA